MPEGHIEDCLAPQMELEPLLEPFELLELPLPISNAMPALLPAPFPLTVPALPLPEAKLPELGADLSALAMPLPPIATARLLDRGDTHLHGPLPWPPMPSLSQDDQLPAALSAGLSVA